MESTAKGLNLWFVSIASDAYRESGPLLYITTKKRNPAEALRKAEALTKVKNGEYFEFVINKIEHMGTIDA